MKDYPLIERIAAVYTIIFWFAGNVGILRVIDHFLPDWSSLLSIPVTCLSAIAFYIAFRSDIKRHEKLEQDCRRYKAAIEKAVENFDLSALFPVCDPYFLRQVYYSRNADKRPPSAP